MNYGERNWEVSNPQSLHYLEALRERLWNFNWIKRPIPYGDIGYLIENLSPPDLKFWASAQENLVIPQYMFKCFTCKAPGAPVLHCPKCVSNWFVMPPAVMANKLDIFREIWNFCTRKVDMVTPEDMRMKTWAQMETEL